MGPRQLEGKRTGRPKGGKNSSAWVPDARWAYKHLGKPDAVPPSALAGYLVALGREHPDRFLACLAALEAQAPKPAERKREPQTAPRSGAGGVIWNLPDGQARRFRKIIVSATDLLLLLRGVRANPRRFAQYRPFYKGLRRCFRRSPRSLVRRRSLGVRS